MTPWLTTCVKADNGLYSLAKTGALKLTAAFVYEVTGHRRRVLSCQWSLFRLDLALMGFGLGRVLDLMKHWPRSHVSRPPKLNIFFHTIY